VVQENEEATKKQNGEYSSFRVKFSFRVYSALAKSDMPQENNYKLFGNKQLIYCFYFFVRGKIDF
jgi:hypothetical protein